MPASTQPPESSAVERLRCCLLYLAVAVIYAGVAVAWTYPLVFQATTHTAMRAYPPGFAMKNVASNDQGGVVSIAARNAAAILAGDLPRLIDQNLCHPTPKSVTLGEHLVEFGILSTPAYALTRNPILAYNVACLMLLLISGLGMFALIRFWTGSMAAAFVAGALFAFEPARLDDLMHPHVVGVHWIPLAILAFERLMRSGRILDAALLGVCASLQTLVGAYPLTVFAAFALPFGSVRLFQLRRSLDRRRLTLLVLAVAFAAGVAALVLVPYADASGTWGALKARAMHLVEFSHYLPGGLAAIGVTAIALALPLIFLRSAQPTPVLAVILGAVTCFALAAKGPLWPGGPSLSGVYPWIAGQVSLFSFVRVPAAIRLGGYLGFAMLAGLGFARALDRWQPRPIARALALGAVSIVVFTAIFQPDVARRVYRSTQSVELVLRTPHPDLLAAYRAFDAGPYPGAIVESPYDVRSGTMAHMPLYAFMAGYHQRPTAACFSSHPPPIFFNMSRIIGRMPSVAAIDELAASGFRNLVVYHNPAARKADVLETARQLRGFEILHEGEQASSFRITKPVETHSNSERLEAVAAYRRSTFHHGSYWELLQIDIINRARAVWTLPRPLRPTRAKIRWWSQGGAGPWLERPFLLPLALAGGGHDLVDIDLGDLPLDCPCEIEVEIPDLGWRFDPTQIVNAPEAPPEPAAPPPSAG